MLQVLDKRPHEFGEDVWAVDLTKGQCCTLECLTSELECEVLTV